MRCLKLPAPCTSGPSYSVRPRTSARLRILVDDENTRSAAQMGMVKTGGNYAAALGPTLSARAKYQVDQVLFCPGGEVQETGASNFVLIRDGELLTRSLDTTFLHGVTRDSLLTLGRDLD